MFIVCDIGGTKTRLSCATNKELIGETEVFPTEQDFETEKIKLKEAVQKISGTASPELFICGLPGALSVEKKELVNAPNLPLWEGRNIEEELASLLSLPVSILNDTALVGLGEAHFGAGRGYNILAYVTVSTGVGGARIVNKKIDESSFGFEPGHQIIEGKDLESQIGGRALKERLGKDPKEITDQSVWEEVAKTLALGLHNLTLLWSPEAIVLGGSMMLGSPGIPLSTVSLTLKELLEVFPHPPALLLAELGDMGGLWGGIALYNQKKDI
jgi:glucokinase